MSANVLIDISRLVDLRIEIEWDQRARITGTLYLDDREAKDPEDLMDFHSSQIWLSYAGKVIGRLSRTESLMQNIEVDSPFYQGSSPRSQTGRFTANVHGDLWEIPKWVSPDAEAMKKQCPKEFCTNEPIPLKQFKPPKQAIENGIETFEMALEHEEDEA